MNVNIKKVLISVTTPIENASEIRHALGEAGAGVIGNYSHCAITTEIIGTSKPNSESNPYIGTKNELTEIKEMKIEVECEIGKAKSVLKILREIHPYEEPAIVIIPLIEELNL